MTLRGIGRLLLVGVATLAVGCAAAPNLGTPPYWARPPSCPFEKVVQFNGDSVAAGWAGAASVPGYEVFDATQGASGYVLNVLPTIGDRVRQWVELCGDPSAVVLSGGGNDFGHVGVTTVEGAATDLAGWLRDRGIPTVWVTIYPFPSVSPAYSLFNPQRRAYNEWLRSGGPGWGTVADLDPVLGGDSLAQQFWMWTPSTPADTHPNGAGYAAGATVITQTLSNLLA